MVNDNDFQQLYLTRSNGNPNDLFDDSFGYNYQVNGNGPDILWPPARQRFSTIFFFHVCNGP